MMVNGTIKGGIIAKKEGQELKDIRQLITRMQPQIEKALPSVLTGERFTRMIFTAMSTTPQLAQCSPASFLGAMMQAAQLGVEPNTPLGQAYLIPYRHKIKEGGEVLECQFQLGYKGLIDLAYRSGDITSIAAHKVCENDDFSFAYGLDERLEHKPALSDRGNVLAYYATYHTKMGGSGFLVMSVEEVKAYRDKYSKAAGGGFSPWKSNFDAMAKKTVIKQLLKYAPIKTEFTRAVAADETIKTNISPDMVDEPDEIIYTMDEVREE